MRILTNCCWWSAQKSPVRRQESIMQVSMSLAHRSVCGSRPLAPAPFSIVQHRPAWPREQLTDAMAVCRGWSCLVVRVALSSLEAVRPS